MARITAPLPGLVAGLAAAALFAGELAAQVVQLPTFSTFTYRGSVMVPDGGTLSVGGVTRSAEGSTARGVPGLSGIPGLNRGFTNRGIGRETGSSGLTIRPQVLIMSELEQDHLAAAGYDPDDLPAAGSNNAVLAKAAFLTRHVGRRDTTSAARR